MLRLETLIFIALGLAISSAAQPSVAPNLEQSIQSALRAHDFQNAYQLTKTAVEQTPGNPKLWTLEGIALSALGRRNQALEAYNHALGIAPDYLPALEGAAELEYDLGSERAISLLERIIKLRPDDPTAHAMLAVLAYQRHDCASAVKHFVVSQQLISSQPAAMAEYGSCLMDLHEPEKALPVFQQILGSKLADPHARYNLAVVELALSRSKDALATLEPLLEATPPDPDVLDLASSAYEDSGDTPTAVKLLRQAIVLDPHRTKYYVDFATISFAHQSFQVGIDMLNVGLEANPKAAQLYVSRGILHIQLGHYDLGEADFRTANRLDPKQSTGAIAEGLAQMQQSNLPEALSTVRSQLKSHPQDAFLYYMEAQILFQRSADPGTPEFQQAIRSAQQSARLDPDLGLSHDLLGNLYLKSGQIAPSIQQSRLALKQNPSDQEALYHLIQALRQTGDSAKGELPGLVKRLAELRQQARNQEGRGNRYKLYETGEENTPSK